MIHKVEDFKLSNGSLFIRRDKDGSFVQSFCPFSKNICGEWCPLFGSIRIEHYPDDESYRCVLHRKVVNLCHTTLVCEIHNEA